MADSDPADCGPTPGGHGQAADTETPEVAAAGSLVRFFFLKTTFGILLAITLAVGGLFAYGALVKESLPDLEIPQAIINTAWPGADPQTMERQVTDRIEDEITTLQGVRRVDSASFDSFSVISVEFEASVEVSDAMGRLRAAVNDAEAELPPEAERPTINQISVSDLPILTMAIAGDVAPDTLNRAAEQLRDRLERVTGVSEVALGGNREEIVQILLQPERMLALGLSPTRVRDAIQQANLEQPFGEIRSDEIGAIVRLEGRFSTIEELRALPVVRLSEGASRRAIRLEEVATIERRLEPETTRAFVGGTERAFVPSVEVTVTKSPGADTVALVDSIRAELAAIQDGADWPDGIETTLIQDEAEQIWSSLSEVFVSGLQAMLIVFVVLFLAISWREGLIAGLSIPITFAGVLLVVLLLGYSLNELVIIGMVIALGLIIDVFIIMLEGLHDAIYGRGETFGQAVLSTLDRFAVPAVAGQLTTILALAPLMAISGPAGQFIRVLPVTTIICLVLALIVALLVSVPLSRYLLGHQTRTGDQEPSRADRMTARAMDRLEAWLAATVLLSRRRAGFWVMGATGIFALSLVAFTQTPTEFFPQNDGERLGINIELPPSTQLDETQAVADAVGALLRERPYFAHVIKLVGRKSPFAGGNVAAALQPSDSENYIGFSAIFVERGERDASSYRLAEQLRVELGNYLDANVAGAELLVVEEASGPGSGEPIEIEIRGPDMDELQVLATQVKAMLQRVPGTGGVRDNLGALSSQIALRPDREAVDYLGVTQAELAGQVRIALSNDEIGRFATGPGEDDIDIRLGTEWPSRPGEARGPRDLEEIALVRAFSETGRSISLWQLVDPVSSEGAVAIAHSEGQRGIRVLASNEGRTVEDIIEQIRPELDRMQAEWPAGYRYLIGGESADAGEAFGSAGIALLVAIILVFGVLVIVFDSFKQAFIILATMPLALIGTFIGFFAFNILFSFFAMIGVIALVGIVVNNGIVMVDTMNRYLAEGRTVAEAAASGAARRLRPIVTTSVTTIAGMAPLAISSELYRPLTLTVILGLISATVLSLVIVPALYMLLTSSGSRAGGLD